MAFTGEERWPWGTALLPSGAVYLIRISLNAIGGSSSTNFTIGFLLLLELVTRSSERYILDDPSRRDNILYGHLVDFLGYSPGSGNLLGTCLVSCE